MTIVAVDWSGRKTDARRYIWSATVRDGELCDLEAGRDREETIEFLQALRCEERELFVGLDFAVSFPAWFIEQQGALSAHDFWRVAAENGERWIGDCPFPFWGRPGVKRPLMDSSRPALRDTEREVQRTIGRVPKSVFQIGGAGSVGTGSIRGMPYLSELHDAGFSIWPFDDPQSPVVLDIYPRVFTGRTITSDPKNRERFLTQLSIADDLRTKAIESADAFDAAVSALGMSRQLGALRSLQQAADGSSARIEGTIWTPGDQ
jgi:hypothetical protein